MSLRPLLLTALTLLALVASTTSAQATNAVTLQFLRGFATGFPNQLQSWNGNNYCDGSWTGISCSATGQVSINLSGRGLQGTLPVAIGGGATLNVVSIDLSNNAGITGTFPDSWASLLLLQSIDLSSTSLNGYIPDSWNGMRSLNTVRITNTNACGGLPNWNIAALRTIDLSNNKLGGSLAYAWGNMVSLQSVNLAGNPICGCMPVTWSRVSVLQNAAPASSKAANCATQVSCASPSAYNCPANGNGNTNGNGNGNGNGNTNGNNNGGNDGGIGPNSALSLSSTVLAVVVTVVTLMVATA